MDYCIYRRQDCWIWHLPRFKSHKLTLGAQTNKKHSQWGVSRQKLVLASVIYSQTGFFPKRVRSSLQALSENTGIFSCSGIGPNLIWERGFWVWESEMLALSKLDAAGDHRNSISHITGITTNLDCSKTSTTLAKDNCFHSHCYNSAACGAIIEDCLEEKGVKNVCTDKTSVLVKFIPTRTSSAL